MSFAVAWLRRMGRLWQTAIQVEQLTEREQEILDRLVKGDSYKIIADVCSISVHTVNNHIRRIYEKMQVHSRAEAVARAMGMD